MKEIENRLSNKKVVEFCVHKRNSMEKIEISTEAKITTKSILMQHRYVHTLESMFITLI